MPGEAKVDTAARQGLADFMLIVGLLVLAIALFYYSQTHVPLGCIAAGEAGSGSHSCKLAAGNSLVIRAGVSWLQFLFWPLVLLGLAYGVLGILRRKTLLLYAAAIASLPISLYLAASPLFSLVALVFPLAFIVSAYLLKANRNKAAVLLLVPYCAVIAWLGFALLLE
ncbi:MAG: hypothetical protein RQ899_07070 [Pseudomonadales bacterium]|nr:hypothetical protein [Pseudomonadales bacterium]